MELIVKIQEVPAFNGEFLFVSRFLDTDGKELKGYWCISATKEFAFNDLMSTYGGNIHHIIHIEYIDRYGTVEISPVPDINSDPIETVTETYERYKIMGEKLDVLSAFSKKYSFGISIKSSKVTIIQDNLIIYDVDKGSVYRSIEHALAFAFDYKWTKDRVGD